ncbi:MAG: hypothetical protein A3G29_15080 [Burkholderiales bacterium RIFCSPLOWO2_12_FULL_64_99]|nr:MAG: hypothetical protein A3G29_15080 [Burkholderiales bacterium RIFCSPLOWO2_12_FULL_64_99]
MQFTSRWASGTRASSSRLNVRLLHQQGASAGLPEACAQALAWPHRGHRPGHGLEEWGQAVMPQA